MQNADFRRWCAPSTQVSLTGGELLLRADVSCSLLSCLLLSPSFAYHKVQTQASSNFPKLHIAKCRFLLHSSLRCLQSNHGPCLPFQCYSQHAVTDCYRSASSALKNAAPHLTPLQAKPPTPPIALLHNCRPLSITHILLRLPGPPMEHGSLAAKKLLVSTRDTSQCSNEGSYRPSNGLASARAAPHSNTLRTIVPPAQASPAIQRQAD